MADIFLSYKREDRAAVEQENYEAIDGHRVPEALRWNVERDVRPVQTSRRKGRVLHSRRERVRHRMSEQRDETRRRVNSHVRWRSSGSRGSST